MPEHSFVSENLAEFEPRGQIVVVRKLILGYQTSQSGLISVDRTVGHSFFTEIKAAFEWISLNSECAHEVYFPLPGIGFYGYTTTDGKENVVFGSDRDLGTSPKKIEGEYDVETSKFGAFTLNIKFKSDIDIFEGDTFKLDLPRPGGVTRLVFAFRSGKHTPDELAGGMTKLLKRTNQVLEKLVGGYNDYPTEGPGVL